MKKVLIVVDYQKDFVDGALGFQKAVEIESAIAEKIATYRENQDEVMFTLDTHFENYLETQEGNNLPVVHCIKGSDGWMLYGKIASLKQQNDKVFEKSGFGSGELYEYLKSNTYESIELAGVVSNICVISNAVLAKTALPEVPVLVDSKCIASNDDTLNEAAIQVMKSIQVQVL